MRTMFNDKEATFRKVCNDVTAFFQTYDAAFKIFVHRPLVASGALEDPEREWKKKKTISEVIVNSYTSQIHSPTK